VRTAVRFFFVVVVAVVVAAFAHEAVKGSCAVVGFAGAAPTTTLALEVFGAAGVAGVLVATGIRLVARRVCAHDGRNQKRCERDHERE
jgi:hypothetical protein